MMKKTMAVLIVLSQLAIAGAVSAEPFSYCPMMLHPNQVSFQECAQPKPCCDGCSLGNPFSKLDSLGPEHFSITPISGTNSGMIYSDKNFLKPAPISRHDYAGNTESPPNKDLNDLYSEYRI